MCAIVFTKSARVEKISKKEVRAAVVLPVADLKEKNSLYNHVHVKAVADGIHCSD